MMHTAMDKQHYTTQPVGERTTRTWLRILRARIFRPLLRVASVIIIIVQTACCRSTPPVIGADGHMGPAPPRGYPNMAVLKAALALGAVDLVDLEPNVPASVDPVRDVVYRSVDGVDLALDIYRPRDASAPLPTLVFVHGGSWKAGDRNDYLPYLVAFAQEGFVTITVSYRLTPQAGFPAPVTDLNCALGWIGEHADEYGIDPDRTALIGGSAGAHLALMAAYAPGVPAFGCPPGTGRPAAVNIRAVIDFYGPADFTTAFARQHPTIEGFLGTSYESNPELYSSASPAAYVTSGDPPTLIFHGTIDDVVPVAQSDLLKTALDHAGVVNEYHRLKGWPHTMDAAAAVNTYCSYYMLRFLRRHVLGS